MAKKLGGFNMIDIYCQEKLLNLSWITCLLSDTLQISVWQNYICSAFLIPIVDILKCNFSYTHYKRLLVMKIPKVWEDIFLIWFHEHYLPECCTQLHCQAILESLVCFSFAKNVKTFTKNHFHYKIYQILSLYDILTWVDFIANAAIVGGLMLIDLEICMYLGKRIFNLNLYL